MTDAPPMTAATQAFSSRSRSPTSHLAYTETLDGPGELSPADRDYSDMDTSPADYPSNSENSTLSAPPSDGMFSYADISRYQDGEPEIRIGNDNKACDSQLVLESRGYMYSRDSDSL